MTEDATTTPRLAGRTALVTGAGQGLGRAEAMALSAAGASVVVNDVDQSAAQGVVDEIVAAGGKGLAVAGDVSQWSTGESLVQAAVQEYGQLDILVNNAGVLRDRLIFNISESEWDTVLGVHLKGHAATTRFATAHWRERSKAGEQVDARVVNTSSEAFLFGSPGQPNYAAAKAGITALTLSTAHGCARFGVKANVVCPRARTAMTANVFGEAPSGDGVDPLSVEHVAPLVTWLASPAAEKITGQVFVAYGPMVALATAPGVEQRFDATSPTWTLDGLDAALGSYFADRDPSKGFTAAEFYALT